MGPHQPGGPRAPKHVKTALQSVGLHHVHSFEGFPGFGYRKEYPCSYPLRALGLSVIEGTYIVRWRSGLMPVNTELLRYSNVYFVSINVPIFSSSLIARWRFVSFTGGVVTTYSVLSAKLQTKKYMQLLSNGVISKLDRLRCLAMRSCRWKPWRKYTQARSQPSGNGGGSFSSDIEPFSGFENWSSQWLSRGNLDF